MLYKSKISLVVLIFSFTSVFSQDIANYSAFKKQINNSDKNQSISNSENLYKDLSISINYGMTKFNGDISQYPFASSEQNDQYGKTFFKDSRSAFSLSLEKKINEKVSFSIEYVTGEFAGLRRPNEYEGYEIDYPYEITDNSRWKDGNKFVTSFNEADILLNYDLNSNIEKLIKTELPKNISVIVKIGFGYNVFRSLRTNLYTDEYVYSFGYDELTKNESDAVTETVIIYGAKIKYEIQNDLSVLVDYTVRNSMSDKWDSSIMDGGNGGDRFSLFSFGLAYDLSATK
jgi:hypothetical protein